MSYFHSIFTPTSSDLFVCLSWYILSALYSASNNSFIVKDGLKGIGESHEYSIRTRTTSDKSAELTTALRIVVYCFLNSFVNAIEF